MSPSATQQVLGAGLAAGAIATIGYGLWIAWLASSSRRWPGTAGLVLEATLKSKRHDVWAQTPAKYRAHIRYRYNVDGHLYEGSRVAFGDFIWTSFRPTVVRLIAELAPGTIATVYYDPSRPGRSVLQPGTNWAIYVLPTIAVLPLLVGLLLLYD